jgi:hypothetical protein
MSRREGQDLGPYGAVDAEAAEELEMVAPGLGITPACERLQAEGDQLLASGRRRVEVPGSPVWVFQDESAAGAEQPYVGLQLVVATAGGR